MILFWIAIAMLTGEAVNLWRKNNVSTSQGY